MENILVVVFESERQADEGFNALNQLDSDGKISISAAALIEKHADGTVSEIERQGNFAFHTIAGTSLGSLIGLLGGLAGFGIGATVGGVTGIIRDLHAAGANRHFVDDVSAILEPGKFAVVAAVSEESTTPVNAHMKPLGGVVFRTEKEYFEEELRTREVAAIRAQIDQLKGEQKMAAADRKAKIQAQIDNLSQKSQEMQAEATKRAEQIKSETEAKLQALQEKAAKAQGEAKTAINAQIDQLRKQYEESVAKLKNVTAAKLTESGAKIKKAG